MLLSLNSLTPASSLRLLFNSFTIKYLTWSTREWSHSSQGSKRLSEVSSQSLCRELWKLHGPLITNGSSGQIRKWCLVWLKVQLEAESSWLTLITLSSISYSRQGRARSLFPSCKTVDVDTKLCSLTVTFLSKSSVSTKKCNNHPNSLNISRLMNQSSPKSSTQNLLSTMWRILLRATHFKRISSSRFFLHFRVWSLTHIFKASTLNSLWRERFGTERSLRQLVLQWGMWTLMTLILGNLSLTGTWALSLKIFSRDVMRKLSSPGLNKSNSMLIWGKRR